MKRTSSARNSILILFVLAAALLCVGIYFKLKEYTNVAFTIFCAAAVVLLVTLIFLLGELPKWKRLKNKRKIVPSEETNDAL